MARFRAKSSEIYFEHAGSRADARVLFIQGLGCQVVHWPESLIEGVVDAGFCAVTFDNRDSGLSHGSDEPAPSLASLLAARDDPGNLIPAYSLSDMARDAVDLLDHIGQGGAHVIGVSMGGMIGQRMAIEHPDRVYSLTSIMSSTGNPELPPPSEEAVAALLASSGGEDAESAVPLSIQAWQVFAGPHFDSEKVGGARFARRAIERAYRPDGTLRQLAAILADGDRRADLEELDIPTLVIHGEADPLIPAEAGRDTAAVIPGATYLEIKELGHDLPEPVIGEIVSAITAHIHDVEVTR